MHAGFAFRNNDNNRHATTWYWYIVAVRWLTNLSPQKPVFVRFPVDRVALMGKALYVTDNIYNLRGLQVASSGQFSNNGCVSVASQVDGGQDISSVQLSDFRYNSCVPGCWGQDVSCVPQSVFRYNSCEPKIGRDKVISFRELSLLL